jgi:hypothetical protein
MAEDDAAIERRTHGRLRTQRGEIGASLIEAAAQRHHVRPAYVLGAPRVSG